MNKNVLNRVFSGESNYPPLNQLIYAVNEPLDGQMDEIISSSVDHKGEEIFVRLRDSARYARNQHSYKDFRTNQVVYHRNQLISSKGQHESKIITYSPN